MAKRRVSAYSDAQRAQALAVLAACGGNVSETARKTGLPRRTISYWSNKVTDPETREQARRVAREVVNVAKLARRVAMEEVAKASLDNRFEDLAHRCIDGTTDPRKVNKASLRDLVRRSLRFGSSGNSKSKARTKKSRNIDRSATGFRFLIGWS